MSALQAEAMKYVKGMTDDQLEVLIVKMKELLASPVSAAKPDKKGLRPIGLFDGQKYIADGYDIDDCNDEIAELFGVNE